MVVGFAFFMTLLAAFGVWRSWADATVPPGLRRAALPVLLTLSVAIWLLVPTVTRELDDQRAHEKSAEDAAANGTFDVVLASETRRLLHDATGGVAAQRLEASANANVHRSPTKDSGVVAPLCIHTGVRVPRGAKFSADWIQIDYPVRGWMRVTDMVIPNVPASGALMHLVEWPYVTVSDVVVRAEALPGSKPLFTLPRGSQVTKFAFSGYWLNMHSTMGFGWVHTSGLRLSHPRERDAAVWRGMSVGVRFVFPEETLGGKAAGVTVGLIIGLVLALIFPTQGRNEAASLAKMVASAGYYLVKNWITVGSMSRNELLCFAVVAALLGVLTEMGSAYVVARLRRPLSI